MRKLFSKAAREQSRLEEIANSVSHGIGLVGALVGTPFLIMQAAQQGNAALIFGVSLFSAAMVLLYFLSTLYHALPMGKAKHVFRASEQAAIFIFIASTYTPFTLGVLRGAWGWTLLGLIWGLATVGTALVLFKKMLHLMIPTSLYALADCRRRGLYGRRGFPGHGFLPEVWPFNLARVRDCRDDLPLLCRALVCRVALRPSERIRSGATRSE